MGLRNPQQLRVLANTAGQSTQGAGSASLDRTFFLSFCLYFIHSFVLSFCLSFVRYFFLSSTLSFLSFFPLSVSFGLKRDV